MTRSNTAIFTVLISVVTSTGIAQSIDPVEELKVCAKMTDQDARFACFDDLGERVLQEESADQKPTGEIMAQPEAVTSAATIAEPLPDDAGISTGSVTYGGLITSCTKSQSGKWYFYFDNGQVWREVNNRDRRFKECNFEVTISKDGFGYKMRIHDLEKTVRVRRYK